MVDQVYRVDEQSLLQLGIGMEFTLQLLQTLNNVRIVLSISLGVEPLEETQHVAQDLAEAKRDTPVIAHDRESLDNVEQLEVILHEYLQNADEFCRVGCDVGTST
jgi:hypothetical protein